MEPRFACYLRMYRKRYGITQEELAFIVGCKAVSISRIENGIRPPTLRLVIACHILFGEQVRTLFPGLFADIEDRVMRGAARFHEEIREDRSHAGNIKQQLLQDLLVRAKARHDK